MTSPLRKCSLHQDNASTKRSCDGDIETDSEESKVEARDRHHGGTRFLRGRRRRTSGGRGRRRDAAGASGARLAEQRAASAAGRSGGLGLSGAAEAAGGACLVLRQVVLVEGEGQLLGGVADAVGAVRAGGGVGLNALADGGAVAAHLAEERAVVVDVLRRLDDAR